MVEQGIGSEQRRSAQAGVVAKIIDQLHEMLTSMELLPGQAVRQEALASRLGVSRAPVREALRALETEGILRYERNVGYSVKRLTADELEQTYLMRRALETEVLRALPRLSEAQLSRLSEVNREIELAAAHADIGGVRALNHTFHFLVFEASGLDLVVGELRRIWALSDAYRSVYLYDQSARQRIVREHDDMIDVLRRHDVEQVIIAMDQHRGGLRARMGALLSAGSPPPPSATGVCAPSAGSVT